jgi:hypothetical protein
MWTRRWIDIHGGPDCGGNEEGDTSVMTMKASCILKLLNKHTEMEDLEIQDPVTISSDEEIDASYTPMSIPVDWNNVNSHELVACERYNVARVLHENEVPQGDIYASIEAVNEWSIIIRRGSERCTKTFSQWIDHEPRDKWSLLYDTNKQDMV